MGIGAALAIIYIAGALLGLFVMRDPWPSRIVTALAWPLGVVALVVVVVILSFAAIYLWPVPILATLALIAVLWLAM